MQLFLQPIPEQYCVPSLPKCAQGRDLLRGAVLLECAKGCELRSFFKFARKLIRVSQT